MLFIVGRHFRLETGRRVIRDTNRWHAQLFGLLWAICLSSPSIVFANEDCPRHNPSGARAPRFTEYHYENGVSLEMNLTSRRKYGNEQITSPIAPLDVSIALSRPRQSTQQLLDSLSAIACEPLPKNVELACSSKVPEHGNFNNHAAAVSCHQSIDGVPTRNTRFSFFLAKGGEVTDFFIRLIDPNKVFLERSHWIDSEKARTLADRNILRLFGAEKDVRRQIIREERWYDYGGPVIDLHHRVCGISTVNAGSGSVTYQCDDPIPEPVWAPHRKREAFIHAGPLTPSLIALYATVLSKGRTLLWGWSSYEHSDLGHEGSVLYCADAQGNVLWEQRFSDAAQVQVRSNEDSISVLAVDRTQLHSERLIVSRWTHEGHLLDQRAPINAPLGTLPVVLEDGGVIMAWSTFDQSFVRRHDSLGNAQWTYELDRGVGVRQLIPNERENGVTILVHRGDYYRAGGFSVLQLSPDGSRRAPPG